MARANAQSHNWWIERNQIGIVKASTSGSTSFTSPTEVKEIRLYVSRNDWDFEASSGSGTTTLRNDDSPNFDKIYHKALAYYTIAKLFEIIASDNSYVSSIVKFFNVLNVCSLSHGQFSLRLSIISSK